MHWTEFERAAPELAEVARERIEKDQVILLGTIRKDGSPRISPVEPDIANGRLYLGMIPQSTKALDLQRDPRCVVHGLIFDRMATGGEVKLRGRGLEIHDPGEKAAYGEAIFKRIGWRPEEPYHLFAIDIESAALFQTGEETRLLTQWSKKEPVRKYRVYIDNRKEEID
ncbi:MAG: pyridoxamine 5'-phosphate oxidase family protein [Anaerolineales bacterium]|nr:pyridoxamine 5'-phosphate oxidase family protein [Anaerolineales bacterium]